MAKGRSHGRTNCPATPSPWISQSSLSQPRTTHAAQVQKCVLLHLGSFETWNTPLPSDLLRTHNPQPRPFEPGRVWDRPEPQKPRSHQRPRPTAISRPHIVIQGHRLNPNHHFGGHLRTRLSLRCDPHKYTIRLTRKYKRKIVWYAKKLSSAEEYAWYSQNLLLDIAVGLGRVPRH